MHLYWAAALAAITITSVGCAGKETTAATDLTSPGVPDAGSAASTPAGYKIGTIGGTYSTPALMPRNEKVEPAGIGLGLDCTPTADHVTRLGCTGLYVDWPSKRLADDVNPFDPALHLWSDGADKGRFIFLPPGYLIDTSNMDEWVFPVGTKLWKEFRINGLRVETRFEQKLPDNTWFRTTYAWSADQANAEELVVGQTDVWGTGYEIPSQTDCQTCHKGRIDGVLGFEAVGLSQPLATGVTMHSLTDSGLLTNPPLAPIVIPGTPTEAAALGWLHANCGNACHNVSPNSEAGYTGLHMRLETAELALGSVQAMDTWRTAVNVPSFFQPIAGETFYRLLPQNPALSAIPYRDSRRDPPGTPPRQGVQMPPLATHVVDTAGVALVTDWINAM